MEGYIKDTLCTCYLLKSLTTAGSVDSKRKDSDLLSCLLQSCCVNYTVDVSCVPHCLFRDEGKKVGFIRRSSQVTTK